jgi:indolepyruvate ferredoxin oxidoreductase alpha subunit
MLNKQRREKPLATKAIKAGKRVTRDRFGIDPDTCTGDHSCIRLSGCPSLSIAPNPDPLRQHPIAKVDNSCVGCGLCGEVAHAAILCPSFYKATLINNPTPFERWRHRLASRLITRLQAIASRDRLARAF